MARAEQNPYAPPVDAPVPETPLAPAPEPSPVAPLLARLYLASAFFFLTVGGAFAGLMRLSLWEPRGSFAAQAYDRVFEGHATIMMAGAAIPGLASGVGSLVVPEALGAESPKSAKLALWGWALWVLGVIGLAAKVGGKRPGWATAAVAAAVVLMALHLVSVCFSQSRGLGTDARPAKRGTLPAYGFVLGVVLLAFNCVRAAIPSTTPAEGAWLVEAYVPQAFEGAGVHLPNTIMAVSLAALLLTCRRRPTEWGAVRTWVPVVYVVLGVIPSMLLLAASSAVLGTTVDVHWHDTYFEVGQLHAGASVAVLSALAAVHGRFSQLTGRTYQGATAFVASFIVCAGMIATTYTMMQLGGMGMPRRYHTYLDVFQRLHQRIGITAALTAAGFFLVMLAVLMGRRSKRISGSRA